jgi:hypothetical protein
MCLKRPWSAGAERPAHAQRAGPQDGYERRRLDLPAGSLRLVRPSFVPPPAIRELRNLARYRRARMEERTRETQRLDKVLQDAGVKLSSVASDILGRSGREMLDALVGGTRDPEMLAELARGKLRNKIPQLRSRWSAGSARTTPSPTPRCSSARRPPRATERAQRAA